MIVDCQWFSANLEAFFCETLGAEEFQLASEHLKTCLNCRNELQALHEVDPLIQQLLEYRMTKARAAALAPRRGLGFQLGLAAAAAALVAVLAFVIFIHQNKATNSFLPDNQAVLQNPDSPKTGDVKGETPPAERAKPDAPDQKPRAGKLVPEPPIPGNAPPFQVITPEGYSSSLQDFRGRVLLFGVWSADRPEAAQNLQRLYQAFGTRRGVQILGISSRGQDRPAGITFPMVFNNGSRLLETSNSNYAVVDKEGNVQMRDSLLGDSAVLISKVRVKLDELGGK